MKGKLIAACMALAAFVAFAVVPASASAVQIGETSGSPATFSPLAVGTKILATSVNGNTIMTSEGGSKLIECTSASMTGELVTNGAATITGNITSASFSGTGTEGDCLSSTGASIKVTTSIAGGLPYCMKTIAEKDEVEIRGGKCSEAARSIKYTLDATGIGNCGYEANSLKGTFTTDVSGQDAVVTLSKAGPFTRYESEGLVSFFCPEKGVTLDMSFTLETDQATAVPLYIK
jgi:hypothetical protein